MPRLTPDQRKRLNDALLDAFDVPGLRSLLLLRLDKPLDRIAGPNANLKDAVLAVITAAEREGWTADLAVAAAEERPRHADLRSLAAELSASAPGPPGAARIRTNIPPLVGRPLVGRAALLDRMRETLCEDARGCVLVLHGQPGVGKTELAWEYGRREAGRYPGGAYWIDASSLPPAELAVVGLRDLGLDYPEGLSVRDQCIATVAALGAVASLLIYDNVTDFAALGAYLPRAGAGCHTLITTVSDRLPPGWPDLPVEPLDRAQSETLARTVTGEKVDAEVIEQLAAQAGGLPVYIVPLAAALEVDARRGRRRRGAAPLPAETVASFRRPFERLAPDAQLLLLAAASLNPQRVPADELLAHLEAAAGWDRERLDAAADACADASLLQGGEELRLHQLFAAFLRALAPPPEVAAARAAVRATQAARLIAVAAVVKENPADAARAALLAVYPAEPEAWDALGQPIGIEDGERIGEALLETGRFADVQPWFERAVTAKEQLEDEGRIDHNSLGKSLHSLAECLENRAKYPQAQTQYERAAAEKARGNLVGRVDHDSVGQSLRGVGFCLAEQSLFKEAESWHRRAADEKALGDAAGLIHHDSIGFSLHSVGYCLSQTGEYAAARPLYERAAAEKEQGDIHGRVDHNSLGSSLHQVGYCLSQTGEYVAARPFFERAAAEKAQGDIHGRVDHASLGRSLHQVGVCLSRTGEYAAARPFFERAAAEAEKGDIHGRIDHDSLGRSLHGIGFCLYNDEDYAAAFEWIEKAAAAKRRGDIFGRVDKASLAVSLRRGAALLRILGRADEAATWDAEAAGLKG